MTKHMSNLSLIEGNTDNEKLTELKMHFFDILELYAYSL